MIEKIKQEIVRFLGEGVNDFKKLDTPSKNSLYLVKVADKKFILKIYEFGKIEENIKSYRREKFSIDYFSSRINEVKPLIHSKEGSKPWILMQFFKGPSLKDTKEFELYKKAISLMLKMHSLGDDIKKSTEIEILEPYNKKIQEAKERISKYLPENYDKEALILIIDNFHQYHKYIYHNSNKLIHGDFVDRNILIDGGLNLIDFENSRIAPPVEDLIFFIESSELKDIQNKELVNQYKNEMKIDKKIFLIITLLTKLRILGSLLRIKKDKLEKFEYKIKKIIEEIKLTAANLKNYD